MSAVRVAAVQSNPQLGEVGDNVARQAETLERLTEDGVDLVVFPECSTTGWCFADADEAATVAEPIDEQSPGPALALWLDTCKRHDVHLVGGLVERSAGELFNSSVLVGPEGIIGIYRKLHTWGPERRGFQPGNLGVPVYDTPIGRIGMAICYDIWFPELARLVALQGADVLCVPANWVPVPTQSQATPAIASMLCMTAAHTNLLYVVGASRVGTERGQPFIGRSIIVDHSGAPLNGPASGDHEEVIVTTIDPIGSRQSRRGNPFNQPLGDRRTDVFAENLGSAYDVDPTIYQHQQARPGFVGHPTN